MHRSNLRFALVFTALAVLPAPGCIVYLPAARGRIQPTLATTLPADAWPRRDLAARDRLVSPTPMDIHNYVEDGTVPHDQLSDLARQLLEPVSARRLDARAAGQGLIREFAARPGSTDADHLLRFVSIPDPTAALARPRPLFEKWFEKMKASNDGTFLAMAKDSKDLRGIRPNTPAETLSHLNGIELLDDWRPSRKGVILYLASFGPHRYERRVLDELKARGWAVIGLYPAVLFQADPQLFAIKTREDIDAVSHRIAGMTDDSLAEGVYAAEAVVEDARRRHPEMERLPLVVVGFSAGSFFVPAVAARLGDRVDAAVLVGGGENVLENSQRSTFTDGGVKVTWFPGATAKDHRRLFEQYFAHARLDPGKTASALRGVPVLQVHAAFDTIVPADTGRRLYHDLGRPTRLDILLGHIGLFWSLPAHRRFIADWVDKHGVKHAANH